MPPSEQKKLSDRLSGFAARLQLYIGQHLVITANRQRHHEQHLNGNIVRVDNIQLDASGQPIALKTTLVDTGAEGPPEGCSTHAARGGPIPSSAEGPSGEASILFRKQI